MADQIKHTGSCKIDTFEKVPAAGIGGAILGIFLLLFFIGLMAQ